MNIENNMYLSCSATSQNLAFLGCKVNFEDHILRTSDTSCIVGYLSKCEL